LSLPVFVALLVLAACGESQPTAGSCELNLTTGSSDAAAIEAVLAAEGQLVVAQEIDALMALWSEEGYVADAKHTPEQTDDDQFWRGVDAIRHRYVRTVFPGAPTAVAPSDLEIDIKGDRAAVTATTRIGDEVATAGDRWVLVKQEGCWMIESLTYNLEMVEP
jgi:hypothetical protein